MIQLLVLFENSIKRRLRSQVKPFIGQSRYDLRRWQALILPFITSIQNERFFSVSGLMWLNNAPRLRASILRHSAISVSPALQCARTQPYQVRSLVPSRATGHGFVTVF